MFMYLTFCSRYYWNDDFLYIRAVNAEFPYGFEYLGNTGRLVITPLTDRLDIFINPPSPRPKHAHINHTRIGSRIQT